MPVAANKSEGPTTQLTSTFLGFELDSARLEIRLLAEKVAALQTMITEWLDHRSCTRRELESLVGSLGHASRVVQPGKTFLCCMFELLTIPKKPYHFVWLNASFRSDLLWWHTFLYHSMASACHAASVHPKFRRSSPQMPPAVSAVGQSTLHSGCSTNGATLHTPGWAAIRRTISTVFHTIRLDF